jgi:hypothetical protein
MSKHGEALIQKQQQDQPSGEYKCKSLADFLNHAENISALEQQDPAPAVTDFLALRSRLVLDGLIK